MTAPLPRVLIVDDERFFREAIRAALAELLGKQGLTVLAEDLLHCLPTDSGIVIPSSQERSAGESGPSLQAVYFIERHPMLTAIRLEEMQEEECFKRLLQRVRHETGAIAGIGQPSRELCRRQRPGTVCRHRDPVIDNVNERADDSFCVFVIQ